MLAGGNGFDRKIYRCNRGLGIFLIPAPRNYIESDQVTGVLLTSKLSSHLLVVPKYVTAYVLQIIGICHSIMYFDRNYRDSPGRSSCSKG
jgi:hypothetical protein